MWLPSPPEFWRAWAGAIVRPGLDGALDVPLAGSPHPAAAGATLALGLPAGQSEDWRFDPEWDGRGVHVQRFGDRWRVHIDRVHPARDLAEHIRRDAPGVWTALAASLGAGFGALIGGKAGAAVGAILGGTLGAASAEW